MPTPKVPRTAPLHSHFRLPETRRDGKLLQKTQALLEYARREMKDLDPADIVFSSRVVDNAGVLLNFVHHGGVTVQQRPIYEELAIQHQAQVERRRTPRERAQVDACLERLQRHGYRPEHNDYTGWEASLSLVLHGVNIRLHRITERSPEGTPTAFGPIVTLRSIDELLALAQKCRAV